MDRGESPRKRRRVEEESTEGASTSSFISLVPTTQGGDQYDVFLSFRGSDTRKKFTDHLYHRLVNAGTVPISVFKDNNNIPIGEEFGSQILNAISRSKISIPIISKNYATSKWCLRELIHMIDCKNSMSHIVLPIFYKVKPSDVRYLKGSFGDAFRSSQKHLNEKDILEGQRALNEVSFLHGWESKKFANGHEGELTERVVETIISKLQEDFQLDVPQQLVGRDGLMKEIMNWIDSPSINARMIGIYGMGGIGKTTLAKCIYNQLLNKFVHFSFLSNVRETVRQRGITSLQSQLPWNVREEVERVISCFQDPLLRMPSNPIGTSEASSLRLQFVTKVPATIFTRCQIKAEDGTPLWIELVDGRTNERITSGPLSLIKIEIVVLDGDFGLDEKEDWTENEFNCNIVREREGKRPLITGELTVMLQGRIVCLRNLVITDNSCWMRSQKFRLGARAVQKVSKEIRIREARSESFVVKDHQGELYKKDYPPSLSDEVWRLKKVAKDGTLQKRLTSRGINTVQDFLQLYEADAPSLRNILGNGIPKRTWETIVRHASTCVVNDNKMYTFYQASNKASILFNSILKVAQATLNGQIYQSVDKLTHSQKPGRQILVQNLKWLAYNNKNQWVALDALPDITPPRVLTNLPTEPLISLSLPLHHLDYTVLNRE